MRKNFFRVSRDFLKVFDIFSKIFTKKNKNCILLKFYKEIKIPIKGLLEY